MILDYINDPEKEETEGVWLMALLTGILSLKMAFFTMNFNVGLQTAIRLSGATMYLGYSKFLRLAHVNDKALAQLITCCTSDQERIAESVVIAVLFAGKPTKKVFLRWILIDYYDYFRYSNHVRFVYHLFLDFSWSYSTFGSSYCSPSLSNYGKPFRAMTDFVFVSIVACAAPPCRAMTGFFCFLHNNTPFKNNCF